MYDCDNLVVNYTIFGGGMLEKHECCNAAVMRRRIIGSREGRLHVSRRQNGVKVRSVHAIWLL